MCNEEGKLIGLEGNRRLGDDILVGVFYIMSENEEGELISLTERKIKRYTEVEDTYIMDVLSTKANPLLKAFDYVFGNVEACNESKPHDYETLTMELLLVQYDNDLKQIEQTLRGLFKSRSGLTKRMNKIQALWAVRQTEAGKGKNILQGVRNLLR